MDDKQRTPPPPPPASPSSIPNVKVPPASKKKHVDVTIPHPTAPPPRSERAKMAIGGGPTGGTGAQGERPARMFTPNLAGPDALGVDFDELRYEDPAVRKKGFERLTPKAKLAIYIVGVLLVIAVVAIAVVAMMPPLLVE